MAGPKVKIPKRRGSASVRWHVNGSFVEIDFLDMRAVPAFKSELVANAFSLSRH